MKSLLLTWFLILLFSYKVICTVWPSNKPKFTSSYLPPAVQILHVQTERLDDIRSSASTTTEATSTTTESTSTTTESSSTTSSVTCCAQVASTEPVGQTNTTVTEAAPVGGVDTTELDGELNETTIEVLVDGIKPQSTGINVTVNSTKSYLDEMEPDEQIYEDLLNSAEETSDRISSEERETNQTSSNREDKENWNLLIPILTLERLRDLLTADAKRQGFSKIQGYSEELLEALRLSSMCTSRNQLRIVLIRMMKRGDVERKDAIQMTKKIIEKLKDPESSLSVALKLIPSLKFTT